MEKIGIERDWEIGITRKTREYGIIMHSYYQALRHDFGQHATPWFYVWLLTGSAPIGY